jgi:hypothetical protein
VRKALYAAAIALGAVLALLGSRPLWLPAIVALLVFPLAAAVVDRRARQGRDRGTTTGAAVLAAIAGGLLTALAIRLALDAPDWLNGTSADCGGPSTSTQHTVLTAVTVVFAVAAAAVAVNLLAIGRRVGTDREEPALGSLNLYPAVVAASGLALVAASYVTTC